MDTAKVEDRLCLVCQKTSQEMHFGAISCRACAAFFRRAIVLNKKYECLQENQDCIAGRYKKFVCKLCRFLKCQQIGMTSNRVKLNYGPRLSIKNVFDDYSSNEDSNTSSLTNLPSYANSEKSEKEDYDSTKSFK
ncbi:unnamed protein product [Caenorhabditis angaria]|uniref:Nuclear receptor domain-containing protein n=1 Tax=Caenorhabditis angaria TaxID=860376 RepID=A0A9P1N8H8_9PELO|nr:unnamed protein product [Caenorhabditis angaria]